MASFLAATVGVAGFASVVALSKLWPVSKDLMNSVASGVSSMLDSSLDDAAKERAVRAAGLALLAGAWKVGWRFALALAAVALPILLADAAGLVARARGFAVLMRADFIVAVSVLAVLGLLVFGRGRRAAPAAVADGGAYGAGDRILHAVAFAGPGPFRRLCDLDDRLFARAIAARPAPRPVFITSLARGGTTALLNALHDLPQIATHRYRDMPFIAAPLLWSKLTFMRRQSGEFERAHGDGLKIGLESPEAFDEVFWRLGWPDKYSDRQIELWHAADDDAGTRDRLERAFRKTILLRHPHDARGDVRYLSKNNANIARLDVLARMFPGSDIVVPLREPAAHAASLLRQHLNFTTRHADDPFAMRYMRDIGHLEFGALHRPIAFAPGVLAPFDPLTPDYWLAYWISAFEHVERHADKVILVTQSDLRAAPDRTVRALMDRLGLSGGRERDFAAYFRRAPDPQPTGLFDPGLLARAGRIYDRLAGQAVG